MMKLSIVSPVYRAAKILPLLVKRIEKSVFKITDDYEIILVDDYSPDDSWNVIEVIAHSNPKVVGVKLSRNFGQHKAITAGLSFVTGDWVVVMDCDLQDQPEEIIKLYNKAQEGYDIVLASRINREDTFFKRLSSTIFHKIFSYLCGAKSDKTVANFGIYNIKVIREYNKMKEVARSFPSLVSYLGFSTAIIPIEHASRYEGSTSYSFAKLLSLSLDVILSNSNKPLKLAIKIGFFISFLSFILAIYNIIAYFAGAIMVPGYTSTLFSIWFVGGILLCMMGIIGLYIGRIFDQVKGRQLYIVDKVIKINNENY